MSISDADLNELQQRNAQRLQEAKEKLGEKYLLHPKNQVKKLPKSKRIKLLAKLKVH